MSSPAATPLIALLGRAHDALEADFTDRMQASEYDDLSLAHYRNILRFLSEDPARATSLACECGVSKQALSLQISHLEAAGYLTVAADPSDGRARLLTLTERGRAAQAFVTELMAERDAYWRVQWSPEADAKLRAQLEQVIDSRAEKSSVMSASDQRSAIQPACPSA